MNWINVNVELPTDLENVLCYNPNMAQVDCCFDICFYDTDGKYWAGSSTTFIKGITHWAIPEPPKN